LRQHPAMRGCKLLDARGGFLANLLTSGAQAYGKYRLRSGTGFALDAGDYFPLS
jgi:hypothetical protein